jgi:hypothetical protein
MSDVRRADGPTVNFLGFKEKVRLVQQQLCSSCRHLFGVLVHVFQKQQHSSIKVSRDTRPCHVL